MEMKAIIIVVFVAALAISAHARRNSNERRGKENGRERGQGRLEGDLDGLRGSEGVDSHGRGGHHGQRQGPPQNHTEEQPFGQRNDSSEEDGRPHHRHHRHHGHHHQHRHHNQTEGLHSYNKTGDLPHRPHNKTGDGDQDRPWFDMRPSRFNTSGRKPFGDRPFGRRNGTEEGSPRRGGHPTGNRGRGGENESEEHEEHPTTENRTTSSPP